MQQKPYSASSLAWNTLGLLLNDFRASLPMGFCSIFDGIIARRDISAYRSLELFMDIETDADTFKKMYQLLTLFKRFVLKDDTLKSDVLVDIAINKFKGTQTRLATFSDVPMHLRDIVMWARGFIHDILGDFNEAELLPLCEFGKHAAVGVPLRRATLAAKWSNITGSQPQLDWFYSSYCGYNRMLDEFLREHNVEPQVVDELALTFVPKNWKSCRSITPNTTVGSLRTDGLGKMIERRLRRVGLDITSLQERHRELAQIASIDHSFVTCDQSSASDNITGWLLELLLPKSWYRELDLGRVSLIRMPNGELLKTLSFCTMGIGFTFPLQTLVFYALAKAISSSYFDGTDFVSCYGDDLIISARLWPFVSTIFPHFGLVINSDKSFANGHFRESCGGDYYRGVDVRPFQPLWVDRDDLDRRHHEVLLYRFINGLLRRWLDIEIKLTLDFLMSFLTDPCFVPQDFPDTAGIRCSVGDSFHSRAVFKRNRNGAAIFTYLRHKSKEVVETCHIPYYNRMLKIGCVENVFLKYRKGVPLVPLPGTIGIEKVRGITVLL